MASETAYPLLWPTGQQRAKHRSAAKFRHDRGILDLGVAVRRLADELERLGAEHEVLSSNVPRSIDGSLRASTPNGADPGVALYFTFRGKRVVLACDRWSRVPDNIAAIAAHIEALRGQERWGVGSLEQAFRGYLAIEDFGSGVPWRRVLGFPQMVEVTLEQAEAKYRARAKEIHPDQLLHGKEGHIQMAQLNVAIAEARKELRK